jgi:transcriptional regulator with XRE-family HTH domain
MPKSAHTREYQRVVTALRRAREAAGLTQGQVAEKLGVYASYVSKCESGERRLDVVELADFCRVYGVNLITFLKAVGLG